MPFEFDGMPVRTSVIDGEPWFVDRDLLRILQVDHTSLRGLDDDEIADARSGEYPDLGQYKLISEPGLYSLILRSRKPQAKPFKRWITHEVIPQIRKTGRYELPAEAPDELELARRNVELATRNLELVEEKVALAKEVVEVKRERDAIAPAAHSWEVLASSGQDFSVREAAYILNRDPNISTGERRLFSKIRVDWRMVSFNDRPYSQHGARLALRPRSYEHPRTGELVEAQPQVRVTFEGLKYMHRKLAGVADVAKLVEDFRQDDGPREIGGAA